MMHAQNEALWYLIGLSQGSGKPVGELITTRSAGWALLAVVAYVAYVVGVLHLWGGNRMPGWVAFALILAPWVVLALGMIWG